MNVSEVCFCTSHARVLASHPVPQVELEVSGAVIRSDGALQVALLGTFADRMSEVVPDSGRVTSIALDYRGDVIATKQVSYGPPETPWQRCDSAMAFGHEIVIPDIAPGMRSFNAVTDKNAGGETGRAFACVFCYH